MREPIRPGAFREGLLLPLLLLTGGCESSTVCEGPPCLSLTTTERVEVGLSLDAMAVADLDGDGAADLVGAGGLQGTLSVVWGQDDGFAAPIVTWTIGEQVSGIAVADLDDDGRLDLATALPGSNAIAVLRGGGNRSFSGPKRHPAGASPHALLAVDLDGTSPPEVITANSADGTVSVLSRLVAASPIVVGPGPAGLAAGDLEGDGGVDIAVSLLGRDAVQVLLGDGIGGLSIGPLHPVGSAPSSVVAVDLDGSGALDLITADSLDDSISILRSNGDGGHHGREAVPTVTQPTELIALTGGETARIAVLSTATSRVEQVELLGKGVLAAATEDWASSVAADDRGRLLYAGESGQLGRLNVGDGISLGLAWDAREVDRLSPIDLDGDGIDELLVIKSEPSDTAMTIWSGGPENTLSIATGLASAPLAALAAHVSGDEKPEVIAWNLRELVVLENTQGGVWQRRGAPVRLVEDITHLIVGDLDADDVYDILVIQNSETEATLSWVKADGPALALASRFEVGFTISQARAVVADADPRADLVFIEADSRRLHYYANFDRDGRTIELSGLHDAQGLALADLDADGTLDGAGCGPFGPFVVLDILAPEGSTPRYMGAVECSYNIPFDVDRDGRLDLLAASSGVDSRGQLLVTPWLQRSGPWVAGGSARIPLPLVSGLQTARLSLTGPPTLLATAVSEQRAQGYGLMFGPSLVEEPLMRVGPGNGGFQVGDLDGDGAVDLVFARDGLGVAFARGQTGFTPVRQFSADAAFGEDFGVLRDIELADFDGDLRDELVVCASDRSRPVASTIWSVRVDREDAPLSTAIATVQHEKLDLHAADMDGDSIVDLVGLGLDSSSSLESYYFRGTSEGLSLSPVKGVSATSSRVKSTILADHDSDGTVDVLANGPEKVLVFRGRPDGTFGDAREIIDVQASHLVVGDFDKDGAPDIVARTESTELLFVGGRGLASSHGLIAGVSAVAASGSDLIVNLLQSVGPQGRTGLLIGDVTLHQRFDFAEYYVPVARTEAVRVMTPGDQLGYDLALFNNVGATIVRRLQ